MNITFSNAVFCDQKGQQYKIDNFMVRFRQILYIQVPDSVSFRLKLSNFWIAGENLRPTRCFEKSPAPRDVEKFCNILTIRKLKSRDWVISTMLTTVVV